MEIAASISILDLLRLMSSCGILSSVGSVLHLTTACALLTVLPLTVSSAERSFSKLKIIKTYLRSTILQERLDGLALLAIENKAAKQLNTDDLLDSFANNSLRRSTLAPRLQILDPPLYIAVHVFVT